ncbi:MAG: response regulator, partial [Candidatus Omnitrophica bacterium]|nr:response regulator [Candidatus Omnitrophota bacterium]
NIVMILKKFFEKKGFFVECACDGKEAVSLIQKNDFDIVFLDENMPGLTGLEVASYIRNEKLRTKSVILTGYPFINANFSRMLGADEYLEKPVDLKIIEEIIIKYTPHNRGTVKREKSILIIDNDKALTSLIEKFFVEKCGYKVTVVPDGYNGVIMTKKIMPGVVLLDVRMPAMNGLGILEMLKSDNKTSSIPVIIFTGFDDPETKKKAFDLRAEDYLVKPISLKVLYKKVATVLGDDTPLPA